MKKVNVSLQGYSQIFMNLPEIFRNIWHPTIEGIVLSDSSGILNMGIFQAFIEVGSIQTLSVQCSTICTENSEKTTSLV